MNFYIQLQNDYTLMREQLDEIQKTYEENQIEFKLSKEKFPEKRMPNKNEEFYYQTASKSPLPMGMKGAKNLHFKF